MKNLIFPVLLGLGLVACSQASQEPSPEPAPDAALAQVSSAVLSGHPVAAPARNVVYNGVLDLAVDDFELASTSMEQLLLQHRAYLSTAHETRTNGQHRQEITLKVPPTEFLPLVAALGKLGRIENKEVTSTDVTADILEATAGLRTKKASEARFQQLLTSAATPAEVRRLEEEARRAQQEVATAQANLQQFGARSTWASLTVRYYQVLPSPAPSEPMADFLPRFLTAFYRGWSVVLGLVVVLTNLWPLLLLGAAVVWGVRRWRLHHPAST